MTKDQIRIFEDANNFANPEAYKTGYIINENGYALEQVLLNENDYYNRIGDSSEVRTIRRNNEKDQYTDSIPASNLSLDEPVYMEEPKNEEYINGVIKNENGEVVENIKMNAIDYTNGGDDNLVRFYTKEMQGEPSVLPKKQLGTII